MDSSPSYKVLILPSWYLPEGGHFCKDQALFLKERGLDVHILANVTLPWKKYKFKTLTYPWGFHSSVEDGVLTYRNYYRRIPRLEKANIIAWSRRTVELFDTYVREHGLPDVIHAHSSMWAGYAAYLIKQKYGVPYVITEHRGIFGLASSFAQQSFSFLHTSYLKKAYSSASYIVPVSSQQILKIKEYLTTDVPIQVVSNIVDVDFFKCCKRSLKDCFTFVTVNGYYHVKGYDILLPAFDLLCERTDNVRLRMVGENFEQKAFQILLSQSRNKEKIHFTGWLEPQDVLLELHQADSFVMSSRVEAQPIAILEALSTGLPVVCTEVVPDGLVTSSQGYRVPVEEIESLAEAMFQMVNNRALFDDEQISNHASSIASPKAVTDQLIDIYRSVL